MACPHTHSQSKGINVKKEGKSNPIRLAVVFPFIIMLELEIYLGRPYPKAPWYFNYETENSETDLRNENFLWWVGGIVANFQGVWTQ